MNTLPERAFSGKRLYPVVALTPPPVVGVCPSGTPRPVAGPHSLLCRLERVPRPLAYTLKLVEMSSFRVFSRTRLAGREEASAALRLLGNPDLRAVLVSDTLAEFL